MRFLVVSLCDPNVPRDSEAQPQGSMLFQQHKLMAVNADCPAARSQDAESGKVKPSVTECAVLRTATAVSFSVPCAACELRNFCTGPDL